MRLAMRAGDRLRWMPTDMPNERLAFDAPLAGVKVMVARSSARHWRDYHADYTVAVLADRADVGAQWRSRSRTHFTGAGGLMLIEPGEQHVTEKVAGPADFELVQIAPELLRAAAERLEWKQPLHFSQPSLVDEVTRGALRRFVAAVAAGVEQLELECLFEEAATELITRLMEYASPPAQVVTSARVVKVMDYLRSHTEARPTLTELAAMVHVSEFALCRAFRRIAGMSPGQYGTLCRLAGARRLLLEGWLAKDVAAEFGFADEPCFNRVFKRYHGVPPGTWRRAVQSSGAARRGLGQLL